MNGLKYHWYRFKYHHGKNLPISVPVDVSLELSSLCNMKCGYCYHSADPKDIPFKMGYMDTELALNLLDQCAQIGVNSLKFNFRGESTLHQDFKYLTGYAKMLAGGSVFIERITNSNFKFATHRDDIFEGLANQTKVKVSFDSFNKEVFETQRYLGKWETTYNNIRKFHDRYLHDDCELVIQAVRTKLNYDEDLYRLVKEHFPKASVSVRDVVEDRVEKNIDDLAHRKRDFDNRQPCKQAYVRLIVGQDGMVRPCCPDIRNELILGDAKVMPLKKIFNSYMAKKLRKDLKTKRAFELDPCKTCSSFESFKGYESSWES
jgi:radical SAM protein with 4Fe4S-binding SPASM domain